MANVLKPKRSSTASLVPTTSNLASGEIGVNMADQKIYINNGTAVVQIGAGKVAGLADVTVTSPTSGQVLQWNGTAWVNATAAGSGTVTSVGMTVPTGLSVSGTPITSSGTLALTMTAGYAIPTTASQTNWDTAYTDRNKWDGGSTGLTAATGRTSLGGTTVGQNFFTLTNPTAITFPRINADNTVSTLDAATFRTAIGAGTSSTTGTVTSVGGTGTVSGLTLSGTVTSSGNLTLGGTLSVTPSNFASQTANTVLAAPSGVAGTPTFRALVAADIPALSYAPTAGSASITTLGTISTGTWQGSVVGSTYGGTGVNNGGRTLTINTNSGTLGFTNAATTLTVANTASVSGTNTGDQTITLTGDVTGSGTGSFATTLANSGATAGTYTNATVTVDAKGRITSASSGTGGGLTVTNDVATATSVYPAWTASTTGSISAISVSSTKLSMVPSTGTVTSAGNFVANSDIRLKEDIVRITHALDKVDSLVGCTYRRKDIGIRQVGLIAQDVLEVMPEAVVKGDDGILSVAYGNLVGLLVEAIKELRDEVTYLKATR